MLSRTLASAVVLIVLASAGITAWIAYPTRAELKLAPPLVAWTAGETLEDTYAQDLPSLTKGFTPQKYRFFCGPASITTILKAYGIASADQSAVLPTMGDKIEAFYTGMTLSELAALAESAGLSSEPLYADSTTANTFRDRLKANLQNKGDFVLINYDRRVLGQAGAGHISAVGAYDPDRDAFLVLDEAAFKYPFTWIPTGLLYEAARTKDGPRYRGLLIVRERRARD